MYVEIEKLPDLSRVWIYQSERVLSEEEVEIAKNMCVKFADQWTAHQQELLASADVVNERYLVLAVNEEVHGASGCSIDSSVRFVEELGRRINTSFFDRRIPVVIDGELELLSTSEVKELSILGKINENSIFFNNLVPTIHEFRNNWKQKAGDGWLKRFLVKNEEIV